MSKIIIEGNINFYDELYKTLNEDSDDENNLCQITGLPLETNAITLECKHKFNYEPLYKEIYKQKYVFKTYENYLLDSKDKAKVRNAKVDYFIKCPYCRNIQFTILPYYKELGLKKRYGINSLDYCTLNKCQINPDDYFFYAYGKLFKKGCCSFVIDEETKALCTFTYSTPIEDSNKLFCKYHYKSGVKQVMNGKKELIKQSKLKEKEELKKQKEELKKQKEELKKQTKGKIKKTIGIQNVVQEGIQIGEYVPDNNNETEEIGCTAILKTGINKGLACRCKKIYENGLCKRHSPDKHIKNVL